MQRIKAADLAKMTKPKRSRVMGVKKSGGFDSRTEHKRYRALRIREMAGEISDLQCQVPIDLMGRDGPILTATGKPMRSVIDFAWVENGARVYADAKGWQTDVSKIKFAILAAQGVVVRILR